MPLEYRLACPWNDDFPLLIGFPLLIDDFPLPIGGFPHANRLVYLGNDGFPMLTG